MKTGCMRAGSLNGRRLSGARSTEPLISNASEEIEEVGELLLAEMLGNGEGVVTGGRGNLNSITRKYEALSGNFGMCWMLEEY